MKTHVTKIFENHPRVSLIEPLDYKDLISVMRYSTLILTDSGGIQEEAPSLNKPVLVLREATERQESIDAGVAILVGRNPDKIFEETHRLLSNDDQYYEKQIANYVVNSFSKEIINLLGSR